MPEEERIALRSANMAKIRGSDTAPEILLRQALWKVGLRYRLNRRVEGCRPDLVFSSRKIVVFVDGCFWHGCPLHYVKPRTRVEFWEEKLKSNTSRDSRQTRQLLEKGWIVLRYWEHEIKVNMEFVVNSIVSVYKAPGCFKYKDRSVVTKVEFFHMEVDKELRTIKMLLDPSLEYIEERLRPSKKLS